MSKKVCSENSEHRTAHRDTDNYCWECGGMLEEKEPSTCSTCGKVLCEWDHFCPNCGENVEELTGALPRRGVKQ